MPRPSAPTFRALAIAALFALPFALIGACTTEQGVTPSCVGDIDSNGIKTGVENGCTGFAVCAENPSKPAVCCKSADGTKFTGSDLELCLFAYGAASAPTTTASTSSGTSTSTGTGGGGGAGGGN